MSTGGKCWTNNTTDKVSGYQYLQLISGVSHEQYHAGYKGTVFAMKQLVKELPACWHLESDNGELLKDRTSI